MAGADNSMDFGRGRRSTVPRLGVAILCTFALVTASICALTDLTFLAPPHMLVLSLGAVAFEILCTRIQKRQATITVRSLLYSALFLGTISIYGAMAAYATQRLGMPLRDGLYVTIDSALGFDWHAVVHWIDGMPVIADALKLAYHTIALQIILPAIVLSCCAAPAALERYLLAFSIALSITIVVAMLLPAASYIAEIDQGAFKSLTFSGATPVTHLEQLRSQSPAVILSGLGGIIAFPSFHAVLAVLVPLSLHEHRIAFWASVPVNAVMFVSTLTEGAHYLCDILAGAIVALLAFHLAGVSLRRHGGGYASAARLKPEAITASA